MNPIGIEFISVFGLAPVSHVELAAELGCASISIGLEPLRPNPHDYPPWSLRTDAGLRRELRAATTHWNVAISLGEGFLIRPETDAQQFVGDLDAMCELGVPRINVVCVDPDLGRCGDQLGALAERAHEVGMETTLEFIPGLAIGDLSTALAVLRRLGLPHCRLLIDAMHLVRSGSGAADLAALDRDLIGYVQLCDASVTLSHEDYFHQALFERLPPGEGDLPLLDILSVLPATQLLGLEVPMFAQAKSGVGPRQRLERCIAGTRALSARLGGVDGQRGNHISDCKYRSSS